MSQPFWTHYAKAYWQPEDWATWEKAGRPRVPADMEFESPPPAGDRQDASRPTSGPAVGITTLFTKPRRREAGGARSTAVDRLLTKHGIR